MYCRLKSLLQLMAAAQADRDVVFFTFGDKSLMKDLCSIHSFLVENSCSVSQVRFASNAQLHGGSTFGTDLLEEQKKSWQWWSQCSSTFNSVTTPNLIFVHETRG